MVSIENLRPNTVTVLIGPNGSGKSRKLRTLCDQSVDKGFSVVAVAPSLFDRFGWASMRGRFHFFGARQGKAAARNIIRSALLRAAKEDPKILKNLTQALHYTKFEPSVGMRIDKVNLEALVGAESGLLNDQKRRDLVAALRRFQNENLLGRINQLSLDSYSFQEMSALSLGLISGFEDLLHKAGVISRIEYFLFREGQQIPLLEACSGELWFILTVAFIATRIAPNSVIAIDEPDTSLHPTWQQSYVRTLLDLFSYYQPRIVIATHSPIIISGAEAADGNVSVYEMTHGEARPFEHENLGLEEMYARLFGVVTPRNHYLSRRAVELLNALNAGDVTLNSVVASLSKLGEQSYDETQQSVIAKVKDLARQLETTRQKRGRHD